MAIRSKREMCDLVLQLLTGEDGKSCGQINIERTLRGEEEIHITPEYIFTERGVGWLLGFTFSKKASGSKTFKESLASCFRRGWFDFLMNNRETEDLLNMFLSDMLLHDRDMYGDIADRFIVKYPKSEISRNLVRAAYAFGATSLGLSELIKLKKGLT